MAFWGAPPPPYTLCGCWFIVAQQKRYLPQIKLKSQTTILATTSSTSLRQVFQNPSDEVVKEVTYTFPLYDGVSVARFSCTIGKKIIVGIVKERTTARAEYDEAISKGQTAALLEQSPDAADVFTTSIGNVPAGEEVIIEITYLGELKNDAETDGARFTIPTQIAPRYGNTLEPPTTSTAQNEGGIEIIVDICLEEGDMIRGIQSPSHPIAVTMGKMSTNANEDAFDPHIGSSTLTVGSTALDKDFIIIIQSKGQGTPRALLETHKDLPNQRAIMTTLVPKFNLPNESPEIVFVVDRSGSMGGKMHLVIEALKVFLKSLPVSVKFNICSFGSHHTFLFERSQVYAATSLKTAMDHIQPHSFDADYGGTEMLQPVQDVLKRRYKDLPLEVLLLTDGEIWRQDEMFALVTEASKQRARFFTLGIGSQASSSLVEGIARAGRGFAQWVNDGERIDKRIVRMLKAALTPHIEYKIEIKYGGSKADEDDFEIIESLEKSIESLEITDTQDKPTVTKKVISLFNPKSKDEPTNPPAGRYDHVPGISVPHVLQAPFSIPQLYPHSRSTIYLILSPDAPTAAIKSISLRGKSGHGDLELELPVQDVGAGTTIHQLAAKKAMQELEEGRGWITEAKDSKGKFLKSSSAGNFDLMVEREEVRLGTTFQVAGKHCSFVAVLKGDKDTEIKQTTYTAAEKELEEYQGNLAFSGQMKSTKKAKATSSLLSGRGGGPFGFGSVQARRMSPSTQQFGGLGGGLFGIGAAPGSSSSLSSQTNFSAGALFGSSSGIVDEKRKRNAGSSARFRERRKESQSAAASFSAQPVFGGAPAPSRAGFGSAPPPTGGLFGSVAPTAPLSAAPQASFVPPSFGSRRSESSHDQMHDEESEVLESSDRDSLTSANAFGHIDKATDKLENMQKLVDLQTFVGSWSVTAELLAIISQNNVRFDQQSQIYAVVKQADSGTLGEELIDNMNVDSLVTALVVAWFEIVVPMEVDVWEMVVDKAKGWLEGRLDGSDQVNALVAICKQIYGA